MIKYYPSFRVSKTLSTQNNKLLLNGKPYVGFYYETFEGKSYSGKNPIEGKNEILSKSLEYFIDDRKKIGSDKNGKIATRDRQKNSPIPYYPYPLQKDYDKGFINRYFLKRENDRGYVIEISESEYADILNGDANYDVSRLQVIKILWKISGPLRNKRISQYDTRAGIIDTNERLVLDAEKTFVGIKAFINGKYDQFARPTE